MVVQFLSVLLYLVPVIYTLLIDRNVVRVGTSTFKLWIDWPYFVLFGSILVLLVCCIVFGSKMLNNMKSLLLLQLTIYGCHQFEEHAYDLYGRSNYFIHFVNHHVLGRPYNMQCDEYYLTQRHVYIINIVYIWIMIPLCMLISNSYPFRNLCVVTIGMIAVNGFAHCLSAIITFQYNPGLLTSVTLFIPYCYYTLHKMIQNGYMLSSDIGLSLIYGVLCHIPMMTMVFIASKNVINELQILTIYFIVLFVINMTYFMAFSQRRTLKKE